jgi:hypothetical protein
MSSMEEPVLLHTKDYLTRFDVASFLVLQDDHFNQCQNDPCRWDFFVKNTIQSVSDQREYLKGGKALEFGGGPTLWPSFIMAQYVAELCFCDYTPQNLVAVKSWLEQKPDAHDWSPIFKYMKMKHAEVVADSQLNTKDLNEWETRLRDALNRGGLSTCDVNDPNCPVLNGQANEYVLIFSSLCLEAACLTMDIYKRTIGRLMRLLKSGGMLLLLVVRNETNYCIGNETFFCLPLNEENIQQVLKEMSFVNIHVDSQDVA